MPVTLNNTTITIDDGTNNFVLETVKTHVPEVNIDKTITNEPTATPSVPTQIPADMYQYHILTYEGTAGYTSTTDGNQRSYNINFDENVVADILIVGGGGAGGGGGGTGTGAGGGGGGQVRLIQSFQATTGASYNVSVGRGGQGIFNTSYMTGSSGYNSSFDTYVSLGGGGGGIRDYSGSATYTGGGAGGYGGGAGDGTGYDGGLGGVSGAPAGQRGGGGGAGSGGDGGDYSGASGGYGGIGIDRVGDFIFGENFGTSVGYLEGGTTWFGGGGGGSGESGAGTNGVGRHGGTSGNNSTGISQSASWGGGSGGAVVLNANTDVDGDGSYDHKVGDGGSGIVIIRYYYVSSITHKYLTFQYSPYAKLEADYNNLKLHYKFDEDGSGSGLKDETNNYPLTNSGTNVTFTSTEKVVGTSSYFPATGTNHLSITNNFNPYSLWNGNGITISWWAKLSSSQIYGRIFEFGTDTNNRITNYASNGLMSITIRKNGSNDGFVLFENNNGVGVWKHYVWSVSSAGVWSSYLNGVNQNISNTRNIPDIPYPYSRLGEAIYGASYDQLQGYIDDFRVYNKVLSSTEVSKLYNDTNKTETTYTLNVPEDTTCDVLVINNTQSYKATGETLNGTYNVIVGSNSKIEKDGTDLYVPNSELSITDNITGESISYGLNNPIVIIRYSTKYIRQHPAYDAQWTYHSTNPNVHHYGNVGIGALASETNKLTVKGDVNVIGDIYENNNKIAYGWNVSGNSIYNQFGNVGIGTTDPRYGLDTTGIIYAGQGGITESGSTTWTITSDNRIKDNIEKASYDICSENIKNINLYRFNYNDKYVKTTDKNQLGFIAQDVRKYFPKAVKNKTTKFDGEVIHNLLSVDVTQMNYAMYGAVKHIGQDIDAIKEKLGITDVPTEIKNEPYAIEVDPFNDPDVELPTVNEEPATN